jgi:hypothetical protein
VKLLDHDIFVARWREQQRLLPRLLLRRAQEDYERTRDTARPVASITSDGEDVAHRMIREGLASGTEVAACGEHLDAAFDDDGRLSTRGTVTCRQCLRLLRKVAGPGSCEEQHLKRAALRKRARR